MKNHIIICGLGDVGFRTFELLKQAKQEIVVISKKAHEELRYRVDESGSLFILGDARNERLLLEAGIPHAKAILILTDHDMTNTTIVANARSFNPNIKIIARMHDSELGTHLSKSFGIHQVFSPSELVASIFARSIIDRTIVAQFTLDKKIYMISDQNAIDNDNQTGTISTSFPMPLTVTPVKIQKPKKTPLRHFSRKLKFLFSPAFAHLRLLILIFVCIILSSALLLTFAMPLPYIDALYFVIATVTTVGYGDFNFFHSPSALKIFGCLLMLSGATAIALLFSSIIEIIIRRKLPSILGGFPIPKKDHVIIVGAGRIGHNIVTSLLEQHMPIVVVKDDGRNSYSAHINLQVALVEGYLSSRETLKAAKIQTAKAILVVTEDDVENLSISLAAKKINPNIINVIRLFNYDLSNRLQSALSLDRVFNIANITAPYFAAAVFGEEILTALTLGNKLLFLSKGPGEQDNLGNNYLILDHKTYQDIRLCTIPLG